MNLQIQIMLQQAIQKFQDGDFDGADLLLNNILKMDSKNLPALHVLGLIKASQANYIEAADFLGKAALICPNDASIQYNLAKALMDSGNHKDALTHHKEAVSLAPRNPEAWFSYGRSAANLGLYEDSLVFYDNALALKFDYAEALLNKILALIELKRYEEAITSIEKALVINPNLTAAWANKGMIFHILQRFDESLACYDKALSLKPDYHEVWTNKGGVLRELKYFDESLTCYDKALSLKPDYHEALTNKGVTLHALKRFDEAISHYDKALSLKPDYHEALTNKGLTLNFLGRHSESAKYFLSAHQALSQDSYLLGISNHQMMLACDWSNYENNIAELFKLTDKLKKGADPFGFQGIAYSEELLKKCAEIYSNDKFPKLGNLSESLKYKHNKIRIGYLCGEFRDHATSILMTRAWELHDKSKFQIFAFDNGWDDDSEYRQRIKKAFSKIFDISSLSDIDAAKLIQFHEIDILVNLNGFFGLARQGVFSYKPAPIQVNYLGFPGTIGSNYIDYIIADKVVLPVESRKYYAEKVAYLPNSYQATDNRRIISKRQFTKTELGLPKHSFVFACFNNNYKITPSTFDSWMRILNHVSGSVLWLLADNSITQENLIKEAADRGIDSSRIIFAQRISISEHLARHNLADLFLDTLPYNAHTTCSDALWAGLPVLTLRGNTFPGRVASSLLKAIGLDELIAYSDEEYESIAINLATMPEKLNAIRKKLAQNRLTTPLYDTRTFIKNLESTYIKMYQKYEADLVPDHIDL